MSAIVKDMRRFPGLSRRQLFTCVIVGLLIAWAEWHAIGLVLGLLTVFLGYRISVRLNPRKLHHQCRGTGRYQGRIFGWTFHRCRRCNGTGRKIRWGARHMGPGYARTEHVLAGRAAKTRTKDHSWR